MFRRVLPVREQRRALSAQMLASSVHYGIKISDRGGLPTCPGIKVTFSNSALGLTCFLTCNRKALASGKGLELRGGRQYEQYISQRSIFNWPDVGHLWRCVGSSQGMAMYLRHKLRGRLKMEWRKDFGGKTLEGRCN